MITRQTENGLEVEVEKNGKTEWRAAYVETSGFREMHRERNSRVIARSVRPVLYVGEHLMETIEGRFMIVDGLKPARELTDAEFREAMEGP